MRTAKQTLEDQYLEMRWRCLSLAADLDRVQNAPGGAEVLQFDARFAKLRQAMALLTDAHSNRAEKVQLLLSDPLT
jgi:hypothetical protein